MVDTKKLREDDVLVGVKEPNVEGRWEYRQIYLVVKPIVDPKTGKIVLRTRDRELGQWVLVEKDPEELWYALSKLNFLDQKLREYKRAEEGYSSVRKY